MTDRVYDLLPFLQVPLSTLRYLKNSAEALDEWSVLTLKKPLIIVPPRMEAIRPLFPFNRRGAQWVNGF
ncbi:MAG: hypothetical protein VX435_15780, partial [Planctomycetota bacterium]|nr:hypothetical protein [Planctomycetota bacterium]